MPFHSATIFTLAHLLPHLLIFHNKKKTQFKLAPLCQNYCWRTPLLHFGGSNVGSMLLWHLNVNMLCICRVTPPLFNLYHRRYCHTFWVRNKFEYTYAWCYSLSNKSLMSNVRAAQSLRILFRWILVSHLHDYMYLESGLHKSYNPMQ